MLTRKWIPSLFKMKTDGGDKSGVVGFFLIEWKPMFSIALLRFSKGSREAYHSHAFHAITFWLKGEVIEEMFDGTQKTFKGLTLKPKLTLRNCFHKVIGVTESWAFTLRGPWKDTWKESRSGEEVVLTHGRKIVK